MTELVSTALLLASAFWPASGSAAENTATTSATTSAPAPIVKTVTPMRPLVSIETYVREYFRDEPLLAEIARCESTFRQYDAKGNILRGIVNDDDIGVMQINKFYHEDKADQLGYDIYSIDGNLAFGRWLYQKYGATPWSASSPCWAKSNSNTQTIARN